MHLFPNHDPALLALLQKFGLHGSLASSPSSG